MNSGVLRDVLIANIHQKMLVNDSIFFLSADFGSPALDNLRHDCGDRFINVGIAEQNLINIATGLALEGYTVFAYAIAPFLTMRAYEQIRNLALLAQLREININLIGVGIGLSYDVTGPTHHCLEDLSIMRTLPNIEILSPCDTITTGFIADYVLKNNRVKYIRLDGKAQPIVYDGIDIKIEDGFYKIKDGEDIVVVSTGYMTQRIIKILEVLALEGIRIGIIDMFMLNPVNKEKLYQSLSKYKHVVTLEESFINKAGLDSIIEGLLRSMNSAIRLTKLGFQDRYVFEVGDREHLNKLNNLSDKDITDIIKSLVRSQ